MKRNEEGIDFDFPFLLPNLALFKNYDIIKHKGSSEFVLVKDKTPLISKESNFILTLEEFIKLND